MNSALARDRTCWGLFRRVSTGVLAALCLFQASAVHALPIFARQTGQSCVACHAGGQFPELTPYGRWFKLS